MTYQDPFGPTIQKITPRTLNPQAPTPRTPNPQAPTPRGEGLHALWYDYAHYPFIASCAIAGVASFILLYLGLTPEIDTSYFVLALGLILPATWYGTTRLIRFKTRKLYLSWLIIGTASIIILLAGMYSLQA